MAIINSEVETLIHTRSVQEEVTLKSLMEQSRYGGYSCKREQRQTLKRL